MTWRFNNETKAIARYNSVEEAEAAQGEKKMPIFSTKDELEAAKISVKDLVFIYNNNREERPEISGFKNRTAGVALVFALLNGDELPEEHLPKPPKEKAEGANGEVHRGKFAGKKIYPVKEENPRRADTFGWRSMKIIIDEPGIVTEEYLKKGGRTRDLQWDFDRGHVRLEPPLA